MAEISIGLTFCVHLQSLQLQMMTPSSTSMAPSATLTQVIKVNNPSKVSAFLLIYLFITINQGAYYGFLPLLSFIQKIDSLL